jgi:hypothetical protein
MNSEFCLPKPQSLPDEVFGTHNQNLAPVDLQQPAMNAQHQLATDG